MEIRLEENISDEERRELFGWGEDIFGVTDLHLRWRPKDLHLFVYVDGRPVAHVGLLQHTISVAEKPLKVCGIGGVVTARSAQGEGYASYAMRSVQSLMCHDWKVDFGLLFCRDLLVSFYERLGWQLLREPVEIEQPTGPIPSPMLVMVSSCNGRVWPQGTVKLNSFPW